MKADNQENKVPTAPAVSLSQRKPSDWLALWPALQDMLRTTIQEIAAGKGEQPVEVKTWCHRFKVLLNNSGHTYQPDTSQREQLDQILAATLHSPGRYSFREMASMASALLNADTAKRQDLVKNDPSCAGPFAEVLAQLLPVPDKNQHDHWTALIRTLERPVLSNSLMKRVATTLQIFWGYPPQTDPMAQEDVVFQALCAALKTALPDSALEELSADEKQQIQALRVLINAAESESDWYRHVTHSAEHLLWKSVQVMAEEPLNPDPALTQRHALLKALLPSHAELQLIWHNHHPLAHWMLWRRRDYHLTAETAGRLGMRFLSDWVNAHQPQYIYYQQEDEIVHVINIIHSWFNEEDNEQSTQFTQKNGLTPEQTEALLDLIHCVSTLPEAMDIAALEHLIGQVIATPYAQRPAMATSPLAYLLGQVLPVADYPPLVALLQQADTVRLPASEQVTATEQAASGITKETPEQENSVITRQDLAGTALALTVSAFVRRVMPVAAAEPDMLLPYAPDETETAQRVRGHLFPVTAILIKKLIQHISAGHGSELIDNTLKNEFLQYLQAGLNNGIGKNKWTFSEVRKLLQQTGELTTEKIRITNCELVDKIFLMLTLPSGFSSAETPAADIDKEKYNQLAQWETVLMNGLPDGERRKWDPEWQQLAEILQRRIMSKNILAPLRKALAGFFSSDGDITAWNQVRDDNNLRLKGDWIFSALINRLDATLKKLAEDTSLNQDEQQQLSAIQALAEDAHKECMQDHEYWHSAESVVRELSRITQNLPLHQSDNTKEQSKHRHALLQELTIPVHGGYDEEMLYHQYRWEAYLQELTHLPHAGKRVLCESAVRAISQTLSSKFLDDSDNFMHAYSIKDTVSKSVRQALNNADVSVVTEQEKSAILALCSQVEGFTSKKTRWGDDASLTWDLHQKKVLRYLQTPEAERATLSTSFLDDLLFQVLPSRDYAWSDGYDRLLKQWHPNEISAENYAGHNGALLVEAIASNKPKHIASTQSTVPMMPDAGKNLTLPAGLLTT